MSDKLHKARLEWLSGKPESSQPFRYAAVVKVMLKFGLEPLEHAPDDIWHHRLLHWKRAGSNSNACEATISAPRHRCNEHMEPVFDLPVLIAQLTRVMGPGRSSDEIVLVINAAIEDI